MGQIDILNENIKGLTSDIKSIGESISTPVVTMPDVESMYLTDRQVAKKIIMNGGNISGEIDPSVPEIDEDRAHLMVYGKLTKDDNGKLIDDEVAHPEIVDHDKVSIKDSHSMKTMIKDIKTEAKDSVDMIGIKTGEVVEASAQLGVEIASSFVTIGASASIMPPGSGVPVAFSALLSILSSLQSYQTKIVQIVPLLKPLKYLSILLPTSEVDGVLGTVNTALIGMKSSISGINGTVDKIGGLKNTLMGSVPAGVSVPGGVDVPPDPIELNLTASSTQVTSGTWVKLEVQASKGTWQNYTYTWNASTYNLTATNSNVWVTPTITTTYTIKVTDSSENTTSEDIIIKVV